MKQFPKTSSVEAAELADSPYFIDDPDEYIQAAAKAYKDDPSLLGYIGVINLK